MTEEEVETFETKEVKNEWYIDRWSITRKKRDNNEPQFWLSYGLDVDIKFEEKDVESLKRLLEKVFA